MKGKSIGKLVRARNLEILAVLLSLIMTSLVIDIDIVDAGSIKKEALTKVSAEQPNYRNSTASTVLDEYIRNDMFGRHNCMDSELGDLTDPGFPAEPTIDVLI